MTREEIREHCNAYGYSDEEVGAFLDGYKQGRAEAEKELEELKVEIAELHCEIQAENAFIKKRDAETRAEAIDECIDELREEHESWVNRGRSDYALATRFCIDALEQLKGAEQC